jgi:hypothetical protein
MPAMNYFLNTWHTKTHTVTIILNPFYGSYVLCKDFAYFTLHMQGCSSYRKLIQRRRRPRRYDWNWNIVESDVKHHYPNHDDFFSINFFNFNILLKTCLKLPRAGDSVIGGRKHNSLRERLPFETFRNFMRIVIARLMECQPDCTVKQISYCQLTTISVTSN